MTEAIILTDDEMSKVRLALEDRIEQLMYQGKSHMRRGRVHSVSIATLYGVYLKCHGYLSLDQMSKIAKERR